MPFVLLLAKVSGFYYLHSRGLVYYENIITIRRNSAKLTSFTSCLWLELLKKSDLRAIIQLRSELHVTHIPYTLVVCS